jgi:hypothetical protein
MRPRLIKAALFSLDKVLPKFKIVRVRHSTEDDQRQSNQTVTDNESSIPPGIACAFAPAPLELIVTSRS